MGHRAGKCPRRPRRLMLAAFLGALALGGCASPQQAVPPSKLAAPDPELMQDCEKLADIPEPDEEGKRVVRRDYYEQSRTAYVRCRAKVRGLQAWAGAVRGQ